MPQVILNFNVSTHKPMVFRQAVANSPALDKWSDEYLAKEYGHLDVLLEVKRENRSTSPQRVNISTFIDIYTKKNVYAVTVLPDPMRKDVQAPSCLLCGTFRDFVHETNFWMSNGGTRSVIHYDADENIHCIINGSKDFMMINKTFQQFLPMVEKSRLSGSGYSFLDPDSIDLLAYPDMANVQWTYTTLYPADCIYIPAGYLHQVRSYNRTISATILFTSSIEKTFEETGCEQRDFKYTPLSDIDVHWTYNEGDKTIDMGYINIELLRSNLLIFLKTFESDFVTSYHFAEYFVTNTEVEPDENFEEIDELFTSIFGVEPHERITEERIKMLPKEKIKMLARKLDTPHGPVKEEEEEEEDDDEAEEEEENSALFSEKDEL